MKDSIPRDSNQGNTTAHNENTPAYYVAYAERRVCELKQELTDARSTLSRYRKMQTKLEAHLPDYETALGGTYRKIEAGERLLVTDVVLYPWDRTVHCCGAPGLIFDGRVGESDGIWLRKRASPLTG